MFSVGLKDRHSSTSCNSHGLLRERLSAQNEDLGEKAGSVARARHRGAFNEDRLTLGTCYSRSLAVGRNTEVSGALLCRLKISKLYFGSMEFSL